MYNYVDKLNYENVHTSVAQIKVLQAEIYKIQTSVDSFKLTPINGDIYKALVKNLTDMTRLLISLQSLPQ